eukprot:TRINITY_DN490_c0_g1_i6.p1 TRINITY_DN490_c0_g1~~TRINITY_DN490_c0_g1_i6.p1  ORF type:complete len:419 (-),score=81.61 TRINITY_DN490_c0_g1_i6:308-1564(-)
MESARVPFASASAFMGLLSPPCPTRVLIQRPPLLRRLGARRRKSRSHEAEACSVRGEAVSERERDAESEKNSSNRIGEAIIISEEDQRLPTQKQQQQPLQLMKTGVVTTMAVSSSSWNERDSTAGEVYFPSVAQNPALNGRAGRRVDVLEERRIFFLEWEDEYDRKISEMDVSGALDLLVKFPGRPLSSTENESADAALGLDLANQGEEIREGGRGPVLFQGEKEITRAKVVEVLPPSASESSSSPILSPSLQFQLLRVLDAGLGSSEITAVGAAYDWLTANGVLRHFGTFPLPSGSRVVTPASLQFSAGIDAQRLSPKKWGMAGGGWGPLNVLGVFSALVNNGVEIRPLAVLLLGLAMADAVWLGGTGWGQLLSVWKPYRRRILVHEAGHILVGRDSVLGRCPGGGDTEGAADIIDH